MSEKPKEDWEIRMLRRFRAGGWSHAELAFFFEMSQSAVSKACKGLSYRHVGGPLEDLRTYRRNKLWTTGT